MIDLVLEDFDNPEKYGFSAFYKVNTYKIKSQKEINKIKDKIVIVEGGDLNYEILTSSNVDILLNPETEGGKDFLHHRNSGLNQSLCKLAYKKGIIVAISISRLLESNNKAELIGRIKQNVRLCRKYKIPVLISSFASKEENLRNYNDIKTLALFLGLSTQDFKESSYLFEKLLKDKEEVVIPGLRVLKN
ncbi:MAG: RNase P subunit p30 family protein [Candidatus Nanoarchaeia archaeon]|nr:RNase P subunit p30 family protein [Candidatus Nanoarchaeia archaeon]